MERIEYSERDFEFIRGMMATTSGISLNPAKKELVYSRLAKRIRHLGLDTFSDYCELLQHDQGELGQCVNAMTTNVTSFFRENHHFEFLRQVVFSERVSRARFDEENTLRIWSAGCSSGEEPYSIGIAAREFFGNDPMWNIEIDATDLDTTILARAAKGVFRLKDVETMDPALLRTWFHKGTSCNAGKVRLVPEIRKLVNFFQLNLKDEWPDLPQYDIIFCRNVMIYFDIDLKRQVIEGLHRMLKPGGHLFVGHSESLFGLSENFEVAGKTIHRKKAPNNAA
jgi:chemotaxis protein methyltransferase CheR